MLYCDCTTETVAGPIFEGNFHLHFLLFLTSFVIQISTVLLGLHFVYDIFWVLISPYFFQGNSVMYVITSLHCAVSHKTLSPLIMHRIAVAEDMHSLQLPVIIKFPHILGLGVCGLGLGDIVSKHTYPFLSMFLNRMEDVAWRCDGVFA